MIRPTTPRRAPAMLALAGCLALASAGGAQPARQLERLDRGLVALHSAPGEVYLSWRLLATDPDDLAFDLHASIDGAAPVKLNDAPILHSTNFVHKGVAPNQKIEYSLVAIDDPAGALSKAATNTAAEPQNYIEIPLRTPDGYSPNDGSVGDLDGDGAYEIVLHQVGRSHDNSHSGLTDPPILQAYKLDGTLLWEINLGRNIRGGAHYTQFLVHDFDGDGRAEVVCKTADGTTDGAGVVIGDATANWANEDGHIIAGPEFLTLFDGRAGKALATTDYIPPRHPDTTTPTGDQLKAVWGDGYGNRSERYLAAVAYLDGERPSIVMCRGYYTRSVLAAWDWRDGRLTHRWTFDSDAGPESNRAYRGQGNHSVRVADVDGDGRDEILYGACAIDDNGKGLYSTGLGHGDADHLSDLDPTRPGLEYFTIHERPRHPHGVSMLDPATGEILWSKPATDAGRGLALDIDPRHPGHESWASDPRPQGDQSGLAHLWNAKGETVSTKKPRSCNFGVWWDDDPLREILDSNRITKWDWENEREVLLLEATGCVSNNGTKSNPVLCADILGDWREEVIWRTEDNQSLRVYSTTIPATRRQFTLMHDPLYRLSVAMQNVAYNQPTHTGFFMGAGMGEPPRPVAFYPGE